MSTGEVLTNAIDAVNKARTELTTFIETIKKEKEDLQKQNADLQTQVSTLKLELDRSKSELVTSFEEKTQRFQATALRALKEVSDRIDKRIKEATELSSK
jgi:Skp family chaperone for outer membrane proteins